mgnify:CR=1 FL=1
MAYEKKMIVLGIDPGYRNLGISVVRLRKGKEPNILYSTNLNLGDAHQPLNFVKLLLPRLNALNKKYGIDAVASESPPYIMKRVKTTAGLWTVSAIIATWAELKGISFRHASPISLKRATARVLGVKFETKKMPKKSAIKEAVMQLCDTCPDTSHEADSILAALVLYSNLIPDEKITTP